MKTSSNSRRWPTSQEVIENAERGCIDEASLKVPLLDLEDSEILGEPAPKPASNGSGRKRKPAA